MPLPDIQKRAVIWLDNKQISGQGRIPCGEDKYMEKAEYKLVDNALTAEDFIRLKVATGFLNRPLEQADKAIKNGLFNVSAVCDGKVIGMGRLVGDGAMYWYLQEIIVLPEYQGKGIGKAIVNRLLEHIKCSAIPGTGISVGLTAVKGKEPFYEKFGFVCGSSGMSKWIEIEGNI